MTNQIQNPKVQLAQRRFDLEERTAAFGSAIIAFAKRIPETTVTRPIITQLVRAGTSVGANYCEADNAESRKDFIHKIGICKKEAKETKYWLHMISVATPAHAEEARRLWCEAKELNLIFSAIVRAKS
ncbi:four helix bundle protein [Candidatus Uhrbacteria bacterium]|nr:four helix bundle protein [Candidatus Uhrbacteria bacterium]